MGLIASGIFKSTNSNGFTTSNLDTSGATLLFVGLTGYQTPNSRPFGTFVDSKSNTWVKVTTYENDTAAGIEWYYVDSATPTVGSGHNFTVPGNGSEYPTISVLAFDGTDTTPLNTHAGSITSGVSSAQPGSVSPGSATDIFITMICNNLDLTNTYSIDSSFNLISGQSPFVLSASSSVAIAWKSSSSAENPTWSGLNSANNLSIMMASFKTPGGGGGGGNPWYYYQNMDLVRRRQPQIQRDWQRSSSGLWLADYSVKKAA